MADQQPLNSQQGNAEIADRQERFVKCADHTPCPSGHVEWHEWVEEISKTHDCHKCPDCGLWKIWKLKTGKCPSCGAEVELYQGAPVLCDPCTRYKIMMDDQLAAFEEDIPPI